MKWRHQESKDRREAGTTSSSDVIMQCDVTGNDLVEEEEEDVAIEDDDEEADSTADREITSTKLCWSDDMLLLFLELW